MDTRFYLVRHGQTKSNFEDRLRGWLDIPLDDTGLAQAEKTGLALADKGIVKIYSSPLSRALETGRAIGRHTGAEVEAHEGFMDFNFGEWGGLLRTDIKKLWPDLYRCYEEEPASFASPGGETLHDLGKRIAAGLSDLLSRHPGETLGITSHSVTCRILILHLLGVGPEKYWNVAQENCCINVFSHTARGWVVERVNDVHHLKMA